jgi:hypothetical protein
MIVGGRALRQGNRLKEKRIGEETDCTEEENCASRTDHPDHQCERRKPHESMMARKIPAVGSRLHVGFAS